MVQVLLCGALSIGSFAAAAALVLLVDRVSGHAGIETDGQVGAELRMAARRPFRRRAEPVWWPQFERAFADYVRSGAGREC